MISRKVYSPTQAALGTFLGGPAASVYFIAKNYGAMGREDGRMKTILFGSLACAVLLVILPFLPERFPNLTIPLINVVLVRLLVEKNQFTKASIAESSSFTMHSNWRVLGMSLVFFAASFAVIVGFVFLLIHGFGVELD